MLAPQKILAKLKRNFSMNLSISTKSLTPVFTSLFALFTAPALLAADEEVAEVANKDFLEILEMGGFMMYPLALLSVVCLVLIILYFLTIRRGSVVSDKFMSTAEALIRKRDYLGLLAHCNRQNQSVARITEKTLDFMTKNSSATLKEVREVMQAEGSRQTGILTQRISYLSDVGTIAPMAGLLGTVIGMISAFMEIANGNYEGVHANKLAEGVYQALVTTASGLVIGITAVIFYSVFRGRVQKYIAELEAAATHLMALLAAQYNRRGGNSPQSVYQDRRDAYDDSYAEDDYEEPEPMPRRRRSNDRPDTHGI